MHAALHTPPQLPLYLGAVKNWLVGEAEIIQRLLTWRLPVVILCVSVVST